MIENGVRQQPDQGAKKSPIVPFHHDEQKGFNLKPFLKWENLATCLSSDI